MWLIFAIGLLSPISFAISDKPQLQELLLPKNLEENQTIRLNCNLIKGSDVKLEWLFNDKKLEETNGKKIKVGEDEIGLSIKSLQLEDLGDYSCVASNEYGKDIQKVSLFFNVKPKWIKSPEDVVDSLFKQVNLECDAKAYPMAKTRWSKLDENKKTAIKNFESNRIDFELTKETAGFYKCTSDNGIGSIEKIINVGYFGK